MYTFAVEDITPSKAGEWLTKNHVNRNLRNGTVEKYGSDMRAGRWQLTPQPIILDINGNLIDGQHRLMAVVDSGIMIRATVVRGVPTAVQSFLDQGLGRTLPDLLHFMGIAAGASEIATVRGMFTLTKNSRAISTQEYKELYIRYSSTIESVKGICNSLKFQKGTMNGIVRGVMARAILCGGELSRIEQFAEVLSSGMPANDSDEGAIRLRNFFLSNRKAFPTKAYKLTERALHQFLERLPLLKLYEAAEELFPLPGE